MPDFKNMSVQRLRELARKMIGPGHSRLKTKNDLVDALEHAERGATSAAQRAGQRVRAAAARAAETTTKAVRAAKEAGRSASEGARAATRAGKSAVSGAAEDVSRKGRKAAKRARKPGRVATAVATVAGVAAGAAAAVRARRAKSTEKRRGQTGQGGPDPDGYFVARVRGEEAVREAPHPMGEANEPEGEAAFRAIAEEEAQPASALPDEQLGELPWGYGDDAFVALPRDPRTLFVYWDLARGTLDAGFSGLDHPYAQLWIFARTATGFERVRVLDFALESRGFYVHDLDPGRIYRAEIHAIDRSGNERLLAHPSNEIGLPPVGPSPIVDDRFIRLPWDVPLGRLLGPGHAGGAFPDDARSMLARLSDWSRFSERVWGGSAGGMGGRPFSPASAPSSPSSPFGPFGAGEK